MTQNKSGWGMRFGHLTLKDFYVTFLTQVMNILTFLTLNNDML